MFFFFCLFLSESARSRSSQATVDRKKRRGSWTNFVGQNSGEKLIELKLNVQTTKKTFGVMLISIYGRECGSLIYIGDPFLWHNMNWFST